MRPTAISGGRMKRFDCARLGDSNRITYKGAKQAGPAKTRTEIEIGIEPGAHAAEQFRQLMQHLGYRPTAIVKKRRTVYDFEREGFALQVCCDEVETLGRFFEIEIVAEPQMKQRAETILLEGARELGLPASERRIVSGNGFGVSRTRQRRRRVAPSLARPANKLREKTAWLRHHDQPSRRRVGTSRPHALQGKSVGLVPTMGALHEGHAT